MISRAAFYGGSWRLSISADTTIYYKVARVWGVTATSAGLKVKMPTVRFLPAGRDIIEVINEGAETFTVTTNNGSTTIATLTAGQWASISLIATATTQGTWFARVGTAGLASAPSPALLSYYIGGYNESLSKNVEEWNHGTSAWATKTSSSSAHYCTANVTIAGAAYVCGHGEASSDDTVEKYDPDTWTAATSLPSSTTQGDPQQAGSASMGGLGYLFGGYQGAAACRARTLEFDGTTWTTKTARSDARTIQYAGLFFSMPVEAISTTAYLFGGKPAEHNYSDKYASDTYTVIAERPLPGGGGNAHGSDGTDIWFFAGLFGSTSDPAAALQRVNKYMPASDAYVTQTDFPEVQAFAKGAATIGARCYIGFGLAPGSATRSAKLFRYEFSTDAYTTETDRTKEKGYITNQASAINV